MRFNEKDVANLLLGALIGVYGNWLIAFFDRITFGTDPTIFWSLVIWVLFSFAIFSVYLVFAFKRYWHPIIIAIIHLSSTFSIFYFQDIMVSEKLFTLYENWTFWLVGLVIFLSFFVIDWYSISRHRFRLTWRWITWKWKLPKIGILNDMGWDPNNKEISAWTDVSPQDWAKIIKNSKVEVQLVTMNDNFDQFVAILNPYGSVYPETDLKGLSSQKHLLEFVAEGGIFVNVSDIPTYYAYNVKIKRRIDTTEPALMIKENKVMPVRLFQMTPLMKELGLSVLAINPQPQDFSDFSRIETLIVTERVAKMESNIESFIPLTTIGEKDNATAFFDVQYGEGNFIFSLLYLSHPNHDRRAKEIIKNAIAEVVIEKIFEKAKIQRKTGALATVERVRKAIRYFGLSS